MSSTFWLVKSSRPCHQPLQIVSAHQPPCCILDGQVRNESLLNNLPVSRVNGTKLLHRPLVLGLFSKKWPELPSPSSQISQTLQTPGNVPWALSCSCCVSLLEMFSTGYTTYCSQNSSAVFKDSKWNGFLYQVCQVLPFWHINVPSFSTVLLKSSLLCKAIFPAFKLPPCSGMFHFTLLFSADRPVTAAILSCKNQVSSLPAVGTTFYQVKPSFMQV